MSEPTMMFSIRERLSRLLESENDDIFLKAVIAYALIDEHESFHQQIYSIADSLGYLKLYIENIEQKIGDIAYEYTNK